MALKEYKRKRDFKKTPEPSGSEGEAGEKAKRRNRTAARLMFCIQQHDATRMHWDFRLEMEGVLRSWAVPKGPSLDPSEKRLAVETEDHPIAYGSFEGVISEGEYGAGPVVLWDTGYWVPQGDPVASYRSGKITFSLFGKKLRGNWALVRMRGRGREDERGKKNWLLIKEKDAQAKTAEDAEIVKLRPESVKSGRSIEPSERRRRRAPSQNTRVPSIPEGKSAALPEVVNPELATLVDRPVSGDGWLHETKFDGYRILARLQKGKARLLSRNGIDWTRKFQSVASAVEELPVESTLIDGEVAVLGENGMSSFQALQRALKGIERASLVYFVFDLLYLDGQGLTGVPLETRKEALKKLIETLPKNSIIRYSQHIVGRGEEVYREASSQGWEGIVSKRRDSTYRSGRGRDWIKVKCAKRQEFVVGGYTEPQGSRVGFGALLVGHYDDAKNLIYAGKVGTGFDSRLLETLHKQLVKLERKDPPFANAPKRAEARGVHWLRPEIVAEVTFTEWTGDGHLRHPSFVGIREDKKPMEIRREEAQPPPDSVGSKGNGSSRSASKKPTSTKPASTKSTLKRTVSDTKTSKRPTSKRPAEPDGPPGDGKAKIRKGSKSEDEAEVGGIRISHPDRVLYPEQGLSKLELAGYYATVADRMLPHVANRPLVLVRCPQGRHKQCFFQKHFEDGVPDALETVSIGESGGPGKYLVLDDAAGLISLVQLGALEIHLWGCRADMIEKPDQIVFDLDPDTGLPWNNMVTAAELLRERMADLGLSCFLKTTGGKGLHLVTPLVRRNGWDEVKGFTKGLAESLVREHPEAYTSVASKQRRTGKIFIDYLRNGRGATAVAAYSSRSKEGATVSFPISWDDLKSTRPDEFTVQNVPQVLKRRRRDPWEGFESERRPLSKKAIAATV